MKTIPKTIDVLQFENGDILLYTSHNTKECSVLIAEANYVVQYLFDEMRGVYNYDPEL